MASSSCTDWISGFAELDKGIGWQLSQALHTPLQPKPYMCNCFVLSFNTFGAVHSVKRPPGSSGASP